MSRGVNALRAGRFRRRRRLRPHDFITLRFHRSGLVLRARQLANPTRAANWQPVLQLPCRRVRWAGITPMALLRPGGCQLGNGDGEHTCLQTRAVGRLVSRIPLSCHRHYQVPGWTALVCSTLPATAHTPGQRAICDWHSQAHDGFDARRGAGRHHARLDLLSNQ